MQACLPVRTRTRLPAQARAHTCTRTRAHAQTKVNGLTGARTHMDPVSALRAWRRCEDAVALTACSVSLQNVVQCSNELPFAHVYDTRHTQAGGFNGNGIDSTATPTMTASPWSSVDANAYAYAYAHVFAHSICDGIATVVGSAYRTQALARSTHKASTHSRKKRKHAPTNALAFTFATPSITHARHARHACMHAHLDNTRT